MDNSEPEIKRTYHLELSSPSDLRPKAGGDELDVRRVEIPCPEFNWFLHQAVGAEFRWGGRNNWDRERWAAYVERPALETWVAYVAGTPAGYFELERQDDGSVRIVCFGLRRQFFGRGWGGPLLTIACTQAWRLGANRVWLTTCSHDHPHALQNYLDRGFKLISEHTGPANSRRDSALFSG